MGIFTFWGGNVLKFKLNTFLVLEMLPENQVKEGTNPTQFLATFPKTKKKLDQSAAKHTYL